MNARHSSESVEHYTPAYIVEAARAALGGTISLDPASCEAANRTIKAKTYYNKEENGLSKLWLGSVFLNPPGGKLDGKSQQKVWWEALSTQFMFGDVTSAIFLSFSIELLQTSQVKPASPTPLCYPICFPSRRIAYTREDGTKGGSPPHSSMVVYLGPNTDRFKAAFKDIGAFMGPL